MRFLKEYYGNSMVLWDFQWIPMGFPWCFYDVSMISLWNLYGMPEGNLWYSVDPMLFPCYIYDISMRFLWDLNRISMVLL